MAPIQSTGSTSSTTAPSQGDAAAQQAEDEARRAAEEAARRAEEARRAAEEAARKAEEAKQAADEAERLKAAALARRDGPPTGEDPVALQAALDAASATAQQAASAADVAQRDAAAAAQRAGDLHAQATVAAISAGVSPPPPLEAAPVDTFTPGSQAASGTPPLTGTPASPTNPQQTAEAWVAKVKDDPLLKHQALIFLDDPSQQTAGAVLVEQGDGRFLDPSSDPTQPRVYASLDEYRDGRDLPEAGRATAAQLAPIFAAPAESTTRAAAIDAAGLGSTLAATEGGAGYTKEQAIQDAQVLYDNSWGGLTDLGTNVEAIAEVLKRVPPEGLPLLGEVFQDHFREDIKALPDRVDGDLKTALAALVDPSLPRPEAIATYNAALVHQKLGSDGEGVLKVFEDASPEERVDLLQKYSDLYGGAESGESPKDFLLTEASTPTQAGAGRFHRRVEKLDGGQLDRLKALLETTTDAAHPLGGPKAELDAAVKGIASDLSGLNDVNAALGQLERLSPEARALGMTDPTLQEQLQDLDPEERDHANTILSGDQAGAAAAAIRRADGPEGIRQILSAQTPTQLPDVLASYERQTGHSLESEVRGWGQEDVDVTLPLLGITTSQGPAEASAQRLNLAIQDGNVDAMRAELNGSPEALDALAIASFNLYRSEVTAKLEPAPVGVETPMPTEDPFAEFRDMPDIGQEPTAEGLKSARSFVATRLNDVLDGRDQVELVEQLFKHGAIDQDNPNASAESLRRSHEQQDAENRDGFGSWMTDAIQNTFKDGETDQERLDRTLTDGDAAVAQGNDERASTLAGYAGQDVQTYQASKDETANLVPTALSAVAVTAASIPTGGLAAVGYATAAGIVTRVGSYMALNGNARGSEVGNQAVIGAVEGLTANIPLSAGIRAARAGKTADDVARVANDTVPDPRPASETGSASRATMATAPPPVIVNGRLIHFTPAEEAPTATEAASAAPTEFSWGDVQAEGIPPFKRTWTDDTAGGSTAAASVQPRPPLVHDGTPEGISDDLARPVPGALLPSARDVLSRPLSSGTPIREGMTSPDGMSLTVGAGSDARIRDVFGQDVPLEAFLSTLGKDTVESAHIGALEDGTLEVLAQTGNLRHNVFYRVEDGKLKVEHWVDDDWPGLPTQLPSGESTLPSGLPIEESWKVMRPKPPLVLRDAGGNAIDTSNSEAVVAWSRGAQTKSQLEFEVGPGQRTSLDMFGATAEHQAVFKEIPEVLQQIGEPDLLAQLKEIHFVDEIPGEPFANAGISGSTMLVRRDLAGDDLRHAFWHELGHAHGDKHWSEYQKTDVFGKAPYVSFYASQDAWEDYAESFASVMIQMSHSMNGRPLPPDLQAVLRATPDVKRNFILSLAGGP